MTKRSKGGPKKPTHLKKILSRDLNASRKDLEKVVGGITPRKSGKGPLEY